MERFLSRIYYRVFFKMPILFELCTAFFTLKMFLSGMYYHVFFQISTHCE